MLRLTKFAAAAIVAGCAVVGAASAATVSGLTFAIGSDCGPTTTGNHYHSNSSGIWGNPTGTAEVGIFLGSCSSPEEIRGLSEFDLTGLSTTTDASLAFDVFQLGGLFPQNSNRYFGRIGVKAYYGDNLENLSDFQAASVGDVGSFLTDGLAVGGVLTFDVTTMFNDAISAGQTSLGIRLEMLRRRRGDAITFDNFRLVTADVIVPGDPPTAAIPLPGGLPFLLTALGCLGFAARRREA